MTSMQQGFVFGNTEVKHIPSEDTSQPQVEFISTNLVFLNLKRSSLSCVPDCALRNSLLTHLYLEGNQISSIPGSMFWSLPQLQWLDLRHNLITFLPPEIGSHRSLTHLLLEANPISELPAELGNVVTLKGMILRDCPIQFPPREVLHQGCHSILQYLRSVLTQRELAVRTPLPAEEQLQLSELSESGVEEQDESSDEGGLLRFRELKDELIQLEKADEASIAHSGQRSPLLSFPNRKGCSTNVGRIPELRVRGYQYGEKSERRGEAARGDLRENQVLLQKEKNCRETLQKCRKQAKARGRRKKGKEADTKHDMEASRRPSQEETFGLTGEREENRSAWELERHIRSHVKRMQERHRNPRGTMTQQTAATEEDLEEFRKLQARLLERKNLKHSGNPSTIYTADSWPNMVKMDFKTIQKMKVEHLLQEIQIFIMSDKTNFVTGERKEDHFGKVCIPPGQTMISSLWQKILMGNTLWR